MSAVKLAPNSYRKWQGGFRLRFSIELNVRVLTIDMLYKYNTLYFLEKLHSSNPGMGLKGALRRA